nr:glycosyltransferase family 39 protein [uncultured Dyadobacter sp.]
MIDHTAISAFNPDKNGRTFLYIILIIGIGLRAFHYLDNRSLWEDEVFLASSLIHMDFAGLATQPLEYMQRAPLFFLWMERLVVVLWNDQEMALRLAPFIFGVVSLLLFADVARFFLKSQTEQIIAVALMAISPPLIYHGVEAKQYGAELLATVLSLRLYIRFHRVTALPGLVIWGIGCALIFWFSFSSLFVLFGIAAAVCFTDIYRKNWKLFLLHMIPFGIWLASFAVEYLLFLRKFPQEEWLLQFWRNREAFMPFPVSSLSDLGWSFKQIYALIRYPMGLSWIELDYTIPYPMSMRILARFPFVAFGVGIAGLWRLFRFEKGTLLLWSMPVLLALAASSMEFYPLRERMTVFLAPFLLLVIAKGVEQLQKLRIRQLWKNVLITVLVAAPVVNSAAQVINTSLFGDYKKSLQREAMLYLKAHYRPGDIVYVYWNNLPSYLYYEEVYDLHFNVLYGSDVRAKSTDFATYFQHMTPELDRLEGHARVWYLYKPYDGLKLGDIENEPKWYYQKMNAYKKVLAHMGRFGKPTPVFPRNGVPTDVQLVLFEKSPASHPEPDGLAP